MSFPDAFQFFLYLTTRYFTPEAVAAEWVLLAISALAVILFLHRIPLGRLANAFSWAAHHHRATVVFCFFLPIALRLSLLGIMPVPEPSIHDEFSHLLLGDTLAHGRLANTPHALWRHFESIHILQQPHYASMYPPAQGAFLAFGQILFGVPWVGVVFSVGLMCGAVCWMLQGWFPPPWALFGTLILILKICLTGLFINTYLGAAPSAFGAALVLGAIARQRYPLIFGLGLILLMNSRPFEGALLGLLAIVYFHRRSFLIPAALVVAIGFGFAGLYNYRVTGKLLTMPYMLNRDTYGWPENLGFLPPKKLPPLRDPALEAMRQRELANRKIYHDPKLFLENLDTKLFDTWTFFVGPIITLPLLFLRRDKRMQPLLFFLVALLALNLVQMVLYPYHLGPAVPLYFAAVLIGIRNFYLLLKQRYPAYARASLLALPCALLTLAAMKEFAPELRVPLAYWESGYEPHRDARADIESYLNSYPGQQLVIVRYSLGHNPSQEWVYNNADIDRSKIVWARELDDSSALLSYFASRAKWLLKADEYPQRVVPYP